MDTRVRGSNAWFFQARFTVAPNLAHLTLLGMPHVPDLRSPYDKVGRLVYFGRLLDKIRLHAMGKLPPEYQTNLGDAQPKICASFALGVHD